MSMDLEPAIRAFATESSELLEQAEAALMELDANPADQERVNELFRAFHTIKGSAGMFGYDEVVTFTHGVESLLGRVRDGSQPLHPELINLLLACRDHIALLVGQVLGGATRLSQEQSQEGERLAREVDVWLHGGAQAMADAQQTPSPAPSLDDAQTQPAGATAGCPHWHISLRFQKDALRNGMEPLSFLRYLGTQGEITGLKLLDGAMPDAARMDPESCYLGFEIAFASTADQAAIEDVFLFARDDCEIAILPPASPLAAYRELLERAPEGGREMAALLSALGTLTEQEAQALLAPPGETASATTDAPQAETAAGPAPGDPPSRPSGQESGKAAPQSSHPANGSVRVDAAKLEALINQVGELVINSAAIQQHAHRVGDAGMLESMETMARLVEEIRDISLGLRMVQIGDTFNRFRRVVREISKEIGKEIELQINGGDAELDKTVVEKISDPLTHLVRNAIDHGIERPDVRQAAGKPLKGTVTLNAYHDSGSIVIEISDDGGGLSREKILAKALERGLVEAGKPMTDQDVYQLIFLPGFSTAEQVTNLSGRGVGMDVVRRNIDALRGQVEVKSHPGKGSTFRIRLPLTLAIIDGFQVRVGKTFYVIPLDMVVECVKLSAEQRDALRQSDYLELRKHVLPSLWLREFFGEPAAERGKRSDMVVVRAGGQMAGLVVDQLLGEHQTVIKPLGTVFQNLRGISGATILGSGEVAMIIDVPELIQQAIHREAPCAPKTAAAPAALH